MATNFYTGLASGLDKANEIQRQDEAERMARDRAQALEIQRDVENQRANERMGMDRERMGIERERTTRANALSDFQLTEAQRKAEEDKRQRESVESFTKSFWAPRKQAGPDGVEVEVVPDQNDPKMRVNFLAGLTNHMAQNNMLKPTELKSALEMNEYMKKYGLRSAMEELAATGGLSEKAAAELAPKFGLDPKQPIRIVPDSGPMGQVYMIGKRSDGTDFKQDITFAAASLGVDFDPGKGQRQRALDAGRLKELQERADYYRDRGDLASRTDPNLRRGPAAEDPDAPLTEKVVRAESNKIPGLVAKAATNFNPDLGAFIVTKKDSGKEKFLNDAALKAVRRGSAKDAPSAVQLASDAWDDMERTVLASAGQFVLDKKEKKFRPAREGEKGTGLNGVSESDRLRIRDELIAAEYARRAAAFRAAKEAEKQPQPKK